MLKFSGCSCLTSGRKPKGVLHTADERQSKQRRACHRQRSPTNSELASPLRGKGLQSVIVFQQTGSTRQTRTARSAHLPIEGKGLRVIADAEADMLLAEASSAICVQRFDGSRNSAIHTTYRISLRSSSLREPRYPLLRVVFSWSDYSRCNQPVELPSESTFHMWVNSHPSQPEIPLPGRQRDPYWCWTRPAKPTDTKRSQPLTCAPSPGKPSIDRTCPYGKASVSSRCGHDF